MVCGIYAALTVLKLPEDAERFAAFGAKVAARGILLWGVFCAGVALLGHYERTAARKDHGITAFMPLIKRVLAVVFAILAALIMAQTLGANVGAYLTGLGIGGLAFALAAQDTIANMFGSFAVVFDHAFRIGDTIKVAEHEGQVEDIGLRSTRLRTGARTQVVMPNKLLASETLINLSRMPQRRVDQAIGLTYATGPDQMQGILEDFRRLLREYRGRSRPDRRQFRGLRRVVARHPDRLFHERPRLAAAPRGPGAGQPEDHAGRRGAEARLRVPDPDGHPRERRRVSGNGCGRFSGGFTLGRFLDC